MLSESALNKARAQLCVKRRAFGILRCEPWQRGDLRTISAMLTSNRQQLSRPGSGFRSQWGWRSLNGFNDLNENSSVVFWGWLWLNAPLSSTTEQGCCRSGLIREEHPGLRVCRGCVHLPLLLLLKVVQIPVVRYCLLTLHPVSFSVKNHKMCLRTPCYSCCTSILVFELC